MRSFPVFMFIMLLPLGSGCGNQAEEHAFAEQRMQQAGKDQDRSSSMSQLDETQNTLHPDSTESIVLGAGCFWCVEAVFERLEGVVDVEAGYAGGSVENPRYEAVCAGSTGHAEVARVTFDPARISLERVLAVFWKAHNPTTMNRQGADIGTQYRSAVFFENAQQQVTAEKSREEAQAAFSDPIVTEISKLERFWPAESYHQDYYRSNRSAPYCQVVIAPKLKKLKLE